MEYRRFDKTIIVRLDKGEEILEQVKELALKERIKLASVQALGAVDRFTLWVCSKQMIRSILQMISAAALKSFL